MDTDYYAILNINANSSRDQVRNAYLELSKQHHPDKGGSTETFITLQRAYDVLYDPEKRSMYDASIAKPDFNDTSDAKPIFGMLWNAISVMSELGRKRLKNTACKVRINMDMCKYMDSINGIYIDYEVIDKCDGCNGSRHKNISLARECVLCQGEGINKMIPFLVHKFTPVPCTMCNGTGITMPNSIDMCDVCQGAGITKVGKSIHIKYEDIDLHEHVILTKKGGYNESSALLPGDLHLELAVQSSDKFNVVNKTDLRTRMDISLRLFLMGGCVQIQGSDGITHSLLLAASECKENPFTKAFYGLGLPSKLGRGTLYVDFHVMFPEKPLSHSTMHHLACALSYLPGEDDIIED